MSSLPKITPPQIEGYTFNRYCKTPDGKRSDAAGVYSDANGNLNIISWKDNNGVLKAEYKENGTLNILHNNLELTEDNLKDYDEENYWSFDSTDSENIIDRKFKEWSMNLFGTDITNVDYKDSGDENFGHMSFGKWAKVSFLQAPIQNIVKPILKHPYISLGAAAACALFPAVGIVLGGIGLAAGIFNFGKGAIDFFIKKNKSDAQQIQAAENMSTGLITAALSFLGVRKCGTSLRGIKAEKSALANFVKNNKVAGKKPTLGERVAFVKNYRPDVVKNPAGPGFHPIKNIKADFIEAFTSDGHSAKTGFIVNLGDSAVSRSYHFGGAFMSQKTSTKLLDGLAQKQAKTLADAHHQSAKNAKNGLTAKKTIKDNADTKLTEAKTTLAEKENAYKTAKSEVLKEGKANRKVQQNGSSSNKAKKLAESKLRKAKKSAADANQAVSDAQKEVDFRLKDAHDAEQNYRTAAKDVGEKLASALKEQKAAASAKSQYTLKTEKADIISDLSRHNKFLSKKMQKNAADLIADLQKNTDPATEDQLFTYHKIVNSLLPTKTSTVVRSGSAASIISARYSESDFGKTNQNKVSTPQSADQQKQSEEEGATL